jgi:3-hydroxy acid dehydrogenase / malonic semialdehyde reductase
VLGVDRVGSIKETEIDAMFATNVTGLIDMTQLLVKGKWVGYQE